MNATADTLPVAKAPANRTHRFSLLLRREYWEHRGGFLWAPVVAGAVSLLLTAVFFVIAMVGMRNADSAAKVAACTTPAEVMTPPVTTRPRNTPCLVPCMSVSSRTRVIKKML